MYVNWIYKKSFFTGEPCVLEKFPEMALYGHNGDVATLPERDCYFLCLGSSDCASVDYIRSGSLCITSAESHISQPGDFGPHEDANYYYKVCDEDAVKRAKESKKELLTKTKLRRSAKQLFPRSLSKKFNTPLKKKNYKKQLNPLKLVHSKKELQALGAMKQGDFKKGVPFQDSIKLAHQKKWLPPKNARKLGTATKALKSKEALVSSNSKKELKAKGAWKKRQYKKSLLHESKKAQ